ncbi:MAG: homocysteine S-methyltransferase family protein [Oscillospiraceae bacterium]|nr:homocysteine S-methyltransferase family protein [Oscillospiraceae bacterium]
MRFLELLKKEYIIFDGAMGTELQKCGLKPGQSPEEMNFSAPEIVKGVIRSYAGAGSDIVSANTFGANRYKLGKPVEEMIIQAIKIAKEAVCDFPDVLVALDIGPIGKLLKPTGTLDFDEAYDIFAEQVKAGVKGGADLVALQTFSDLLELKAALLAVKENSDLPVICSMTFEATSRTFTGCPVSAAAVTLTGLGADIIGVNCSLGPHELLPIVREMREWTNLPLVVKPNAGLPDPVTGEFRLSKEDFASDMKKFVEMGVKLLGGCCGTSPEYIELLKSSVAKIMRDDVGIVPYGGVVCSGTRTVVIDRVRVIGERINPTGKRLFKEALLSGDTDYILGQAIEQVRGGADILDVNVGLPEINEKQMMLRVVELLQSITDLPLQIDSGHPEVIEAALRRYNGKPIVNSVNGKEESLSEILPIVKKYGAMVIGLTLDENGIPETAQGRYEIAERILTRAGALGIPKQDIIIDCLTLTVSTEANAARVTLEAVKMIKERLGLKTALGVSNVSFGLPNRDIINSSFLSSALQGGLDLPIINPNSEAVMGAVRAYKLLNGYDENAFEYIKAYGNKSENISDTIYGVPTLEAAISAGLKKDSVVITERLLEEVSAMTIINEHLVPALDRVGNDYEQGRIFLPQLILSAETAGVCFDVIKKKIPLSEKQNNGKILLATVKGDIHDIGKNIVKVLLENYGYDIIDLGKDVAPELIVEAAVKNDVQLIGLSALMTTTLGAMAQTIKLVKEQGLTCPVMVGGAVLNKEYAASINADYYARDAKGAVDIAKSVFAG